MNIVVLVESQCSRKICGNLLGKPNECKIQKSPIPIHQFFFLLFQILQFNLKFKYCNLNGTFQLEIKILIRFTYDFWIFPIKICMNVVVLMDEIVRSRFLCLQLRFSSHFRFFNPLPIFRMLKNSFRKWNKSKHIDCDFEFRNVPSNIEKLISISNSYLHFEFRQISLETNFDFQQIYFDFESIRKISNCFVRFRKVAFNFDF